MPERLFSTNQIANLLGVTPGTVGQWIKQGWLPHKTLPQGSLRISQKHLVRFLKDRGVDIEKVMAKAVMGEKASTDEMVIEADMPSGVAIAKSSSDELKQLEAASIGAYNSKGKAEDLESPTPQVSADDADDKNPAPQVSADDAGDADDKNPTPQVSADDAGDADDKNPAGEESVHKPSWVSVAQLRARAELEGKPFDLESVEAEIAQMTSKNTTDSDTPKNDSPVQANEDIEMDHEEIADSVLSQDDEESQQAPEKTPVPVEVTEPQADSSPGEVIEVDDEVEPVSADTQVTEAVEIAEDEIAEVELDKELKEDTHQLTEQVKQLDEKSLEPEKHPEPVSNPVPEPVRHEVADRIDQIGDSVLADAIDTSASAIHLQAGKDGGSITTRVGGVLLQRDSLTKLSGNGQVEKLIAYFTAEAKIDGSGTGTLVAQHAGRQIDLALTALPALGGKRLTIRLLDPARQAPSFDDLGLSPEDSASVRSILTGQAGFTLIAGPDARAVAQLLTAAAGEFQTSGSDVIYIVRKAETRIEGLTVCPIDPKLGFGFSEAVVSAVDSDPDAICIGELCDPATAVSAFEAAQCGTPVLAGINGTSVSQVISLLSEMGIEGWPLSMCLKGIVLCARVKELCPACKTSGSDGFKPAGCSRCGQSGYSGQKMLVSVAKTSLLIERAIRNGASADEIQRSAIASGMTSLKQAADELFDVGKISKAELIRTVGE